MISEIIANGETLLNNHITKIRWKLQRKKLPRLAVEYSKNSVNMPCLINKKTHGSPKENHNFLRLIHYIDQQTWSTLDIVRNHQQIVNQSHDIVTGDEKWIMYNNIKWSV